MHRRTGMNPGSWILCANIFMVTLAAGAFSSGVIAQETTPITGIRANTPRVHALINARIIPAPGELIEQGSVVLRNGVIQAVGEDVTIPGDARVSDYSGKTVYAGLIESYSGVGLPDTVHVDRSAGSGHWNASVHAQDRASDLYRIQKNDLESLREAGFTAAMVVPQSGIFTGVGAIVALGDGTPNDNILINEIVHGVRMTRNRDGSYPNSLMGAISLIRQTLLDAGWYREAHVAYQSKPNQDPPEKNVALAALESAIDRRMPVLVAINDAQSFLRATRLAGEFNLNLWVKGSGHEYQELDRIKATGAPVIVPVTFPQKDDIDITTPEDALGVTMEQLRHWRGAPENPGRLQTAGIRFSLTSSGLEKPSEFPARVRESIERGLKYDDAIAAVTTTPASLLGISSSMGTIAVGKQAYLTVTDGPLFGKDVNIVDLWIQGQRYPVTPQTISDPRGQWQVTMKIQNGRNIKRDLELKGKIGKLGGTIDKEKIQNVQLDQKRLGLVFDGKTLGFSGMVQISGSVDGDLMAGNGILPDGSTLTWDATRTKQRPSPLRPLPRVVANQRLPPTMPPGAFGRTAPPARPRHIVVRNGTVWTMDDVGKRNNVDILITDGKISNIGENIEAPTGAVEIDANGKHVTPGIIDGHTHYGIQGGFNESGQAVTAEVGAEDVIDAYDTGLYRGLSGGLTTANVLHGSANPIGGKNQLIKLRWGASAQELVFEGAIPGIKFALGENVKRSNGTRPQIRYPSTRMGVEQLIRDRFRAAQDYDRAWSSYANLSEKEGVIPPRRDLELEALVEILKGERIVHSHSYRQDEILMLIRVADDFGFTIGTFQHVLEGYKVADAIAKHGAGASTFSDWWGYKVEAYDAIPYNGAIMNRAGVLVSYNSDDTPGADISRRLNTEAAKAVKYGGVSEIEALKFVTINPARQFRIDDRVGSLEVGKDADFVIWSGHPLSSYTSCEQTWIDGRKYFDIEIDRELKRDIEKERTDLIQDLLTPEEEDKPEA